MQTHTLSVSAARSQPLAWHHRHRLMAAALAVGMIAAGMAWQWSWLVAIGVAPLLLSAAPCAAMCALGLRVHRMNSQSCGTRRAQEASRQYMDPADQITNNGDTT